jgi:hypothetical protein
LGKFVKHQKIDSCFWENPSNTNNKTLLVGKCHKLKKALISPKVAPKIKVKLGEKCKNWGLLFAVMVMGITAAQSNTFQTRIGINTIHDLAIIDEETMMEAIPQAVTGIACMTLKAAKSWVADIAKALVSEQLQVKL